MIPRSWFFLNSLSVWIFASGNFASAAVSTAVFAGVTPPFMFTKVKTFCRVRVQRVEAVSTRS